MTGETANSTNVLSEEIKALLILLLLKGGTPSDEIETALRLAGSRPAHSELPTQEPMCPLARAAVLAMAPPVSVAQPPVRQPSLQPVVSAKQIFRNDQLAPLHGYAA